MRFKLLAIRPFENCDAKFLKNLKPREIYQFYNGYIFNTDGSGEVISIENKPSVPENLYDVSPKLKVNISAIVGKNGSGKSSLVELFIACINKLSFKLRNVGKLNTEAEIEDINEIHCEVYYEINNETNNEIYCLSIRGDEVSLKNISTNTYVDLGKTILQDFFYSIVVNYSLYAFNMLDEGKYWIEKLFHKNDAYQVPMVLNPYREYGNIDINTENHLVKQRLLSIIISDPNYPISDNLLTEYIEIKEKEYKKSSFFSNDENQYLIEPPKVTEDKFYTYIENPGWSILFSDTQCAINNSGEILEKFKTKFNIHELPEELKYRIDNYILYKIISICSVYVEYRRFLKQKNEEDAFYQIDIDGFLKKFESSDSHILFKLKQVVNFVKNYNKVWTDFIENSNKLPIIELSTKLKEIKGKNSIIDLLPPPIYDVNFFTKDNIDILGSISSGEKQLIYSLSTILYHITNLNSVQESEMVRRYRYINIILDEIELYFHPEYQRRFISHLLDSIKNLNISKIKAINILFLTHSPFILSDIPSENTLRLKKGDIMGEQNLNNSFAANIHDLLADEFFLSKEGFMGEFAKKKIQELIKFLDEKNKKRNRKWNEKNALPFINMIGEPMLRETLRELYFEKYKDDNDVIDREIKRLQELKNRQK